MQCPKCRLQNPPDTEVCECGHHFISSVGESTVTGELRTKSGTNPLATLAALEAIRSQQHRLEETIGRLVEIMQSMPKGESRAKLLDEIKCLSVKYL
jgi:hypothetical protein